MRRSARHCRARIGPPGKWPKKLKPSSTIVAFQTATIVMLMRKWEDQGLGRGRGLLLATRSRLGRGPGPGLAPNADGKPRKKSVERGKLRDRGRSSKSWSMRRRLERLCLRSRDGWSSMMRRVSRTKRTSCRVWSVLSRIEWQRWRKPIRRRTLSTKSVQSWKSK